MRFLYILLIPLFIVSCSDNENSDQSNDYLESLEGDYLLTEHYSDIPLDLNFDGQENTDMFYEMECQYFYNLSSFKANVSYDERNGDNLSVFLPVSNSEVLSDSAPYSQCFFTTDLYYQNVIVNEQTGEITITEHTMPEREAEFGTVTAGHFTDDKLYIDVDKIIFTADGWQTIPMHFVYKWHNR